MTACSSERQAQRTVQATGSMRVAGQSSRLCRWLGPGAERPGLYGSDLGYTAPLAGHPDQLQLLFGDTWAQPTDACHYPVLKSDDFAARIPAQRPASDICDSMQFTLRDPNDPTSWRRVRVFPDAGERTDERVLDTGFDRTPVAAWSDGTHTFVMFFRGEYTRCQTNAECPAAMSCTRDAAYQGKHLGSCQPKVSLNSDTTPDLCRNDDDCSSPASCSDLEHGLCVSTQPFVVQRDGQTISLPWYSDDPRKGAAFSMYITSEFWPDRPEDLATGFRFSTNKFINTTARTVAHFDPEHPENNDYSPGQETLLMWGRSAFTGADGFQSLPFLLYQPLAGMLDEQGAIAWSPRYFAGYDDAGDPAWSDQEADAQPIYGVDENLVKQDGQWTWSWQSPEFDYVNQMSTLWLEPLQRWVMIYGGDSPAISDPHNGKRPPPTYAQRSPGAVHLRSARHPFGRAHANSPSSEAYSAALPVVTRLAMKDQLACDDEAKQRGDCNPALPKKPGNLLDALGSAISNDTKDDFATASAKCVAGSALLDIQNSTGDDSAGHLYGSAIIEPWTQELPGDDPGVEVYWNVSTWNPYQVLLMKTQLHASDLRDGR